MWNLIINVFLWIIEVLNIVKFSIILSLISQITIFVFSCVLSINELISYKNTVAGLKNYLHNYYLK